MTRLLSYVALPHPRPKGSWTQAYDWFNTDQDIKVTFAICPIYIPQREVYLGIPQNSRDLWIESEAYSCPLKASNDVKVCLVPSVRCLTPSQPPLWCQ